MASGGKGLKQQHPHSHLIEKKAKQQTWRHIAAILLRSHYFGFEALTHEPYEARRVCISHVVNIIQAAGRQAAYLTSPENLRLVLEAEDSQ